MTVAAPAAPIVVTGLGHRYDGVVALADVSWTFEPGTSTALMGPNGSGKTTLLRLLAGLERPTVGRIDGLRGPRVAFVTQHAARPRFLPLTAGEVLRMGRYRGRWLVGRFDAEDRRAVADAAKACGVGDLLGRQLSELSGGQRQRVLVAQALAQRPDLLLLDEPLTGLDLGSQEQLLGLVEEVTGRGTTVVLSTHQLDDARHCDAVLLLANRLVASGAPADVLTPANLLAVFETVFGAHVGHDHELGPIVVDHHGHGTH